MASSDTLAPQERLSSLDQFRGYTVVGMFLVNYIGFSNAAKTFLPTMIHWKTHCSFADTIMPQFLFAVGFGFRMSYMKRREKLGASVANWRVVSRILGLLLVALIVHGMDGQYGTWEKLKELGFLGFFQTAFQRSYFQTLGHIGVTSLWVVPVIGLGVMPRLVYSILSCVLFVYLSTQWYYDWEMTRPGIDGGPLGFLTWTPSLILGTFAYDIYNSSIKNKVLAVLGVGCAAMLVAYVLSSINTMTYPNKLPESATFRDYLAENPLVRPLVPGSEESAPKLSLYEKLTVSGGDIPPPSGEQLTHWIDSRNQAFNQLKASGSLAQDAKPQDLSDANWLEPNRRYLNQWTMSQRAGSPSYTIFGAGFGMALLAMMMVICDRWGFQIGLFRTLGVNALFGYILHGMVNSSIKPFIPSDAPLWYILLGFAVSLGICYLVLRTLEKQKIIFRL